jgi:hypothetical protein
VVGSSDDAVAGVSPDGLVTGVSEGGATIAAASGNAEGEAAIAVVPAPLICTEVRTFTSGETLSGVLPSVQVTGDVTVSGSTSICGNLAISGSGVLTLSGQEVTVAGNFATANSGRLVMQSAADRLSVGGNAAFSGINGDDGLTAGILSIGGNWTLGSTSFTNFVGSGSHLVVLDGTAAQSVSFALVSPTANRAHHVRVENTVGVTFTANSHATGDLDLVGQATVANNVTVTVLGALVLRATAVLNNNGTIAVTNCTKEPGHTINGADPCP